MAMRCKGAAMMFALLMCGTASAKTLYVNGATGNDSVSYASNSEAAPWRTLGRAVWGSTSPSSASTGEAARAGDVVLVSGGPFSAPASNERTTPAFNPINTGSAGSPITIRAQGRVELRTTGGTGPVIGAYVRNYIRWEGHFFIDETNAPVRPDTGPVAIWETTGTVVDGAEVQGRQIDYIDNHTGVRFERAHQSTVRNMRINNIVGTASDLMHHNKAGVMLYFSNDIVIENNEITNSGAGVFPKGGDNYNITIRFNKIQGTRKGIRTTYSSASQGQNRIYQNVIIGSGVEASLGIEVAENSYNWTIANNTIYGTTDSAIYLVPGSGGNLRVASNVIANTPTGLNAYEMSASVPGPGRNLYYSAPQWASAGRTFSSLSAWLSAAPGDAGSVVANPAFVDAAGGDFKLGASSPARILGVDVLDLNGNGNTSDTIPAGAYITGAESIGRNSGPVPNPPTALQVE